MKKYKDTYQFKYERDINNKIYNPDDNYIKCYYGAKIWRYNDTTLVYESPKKTKVKSEDKDGNILFDYTNLIIDKPVDSDAERLIYFHEDNLSKLEPIFKPIKKRKMSEEEKQKVVERLSKAREK